jgi:chromosome partitioning protein
MIITLFSYKGGVGKSTAAIHLAGHLNEHAPTAVADGDNNRSAISWAKRGSLPFPVVDEEEALKISRTHEHILIDTPARPAPVKFEGLVKAADVRILVCEPEIMSLDALAPAIADLRRLKADFKVLLTRARPNTTDASNAMQMLTANNIPCFRHYVRGYAAARKAALAGILVRDVADPHALDVWEDFGEVAQEVLHG